MWQTLIKVWRHRDLRKKIAYVLAIFVIFRLAAHIPIPGVDIQGLQNFFDSNAYLGILNVFSGGALANFSLVMLGVGPYITASIIFQLLSMIVPKIEEMQKESDGQRKIQQWTRYLTVPMAMLQSYATITLLQRTGGGLLGELTGVQLVMDIILITGGSVLLMWLGELITEKNIGNGISLIIFAGIVSSLPASVQQLLLTYDSSQLPLILLYLAIGIASIFAVVYITEAQRNVPISTARPAMGARGNAPANHLPIRLNQAGVIPIIFAVSLVVLPQVAGQYLVTTTNSTLITIGQFLVDALNNQWVYGGLYFVLVFAFTYFYTSVVFKPDQIAENLQKRGAFIPGIRPGKPTSEYLEYVTNHLLLAGAGFLGLIAVLPVGLQALASGTNSSLVIGGTSLLIVVSVALETVKQVQAQLQVRDYEQF